MNNWERVGCLTCVRSGGRGSLWDLASVTFHSFPDVNTRKRCRNEKGSRGSSGYFIWNAKKSQLVWESEVLSERKRGPLEFGMVSEGIRANGGSESWVTCLKTSKTLSLPLYFALSLFSSAAQLWFTEWLDGFPEVTADLRKPYPKLK